MPHRSRIVQDVEIFLHSSRCILWSNGAAVPILLRRGVLFVRIGLNQTGISGKALPAHQTVCDATCNGWRSNALSRNRPWQFFEKVE